MTLAESSALLVTLILGIIGPFVLLPTLRRLGVVDVPNHRSSHSVPVVRGGGVAPWLAMATGLGLLGISKAAPSELLPFGFVALAAGVLGWLEDHRGLPVRTRAASQLAIGGIGVGWLSLTSGVNPVLFVVGAIFVAGYINVANFMDGINGISGLHAVAVGTLLAVVGYLSAREWLVTGGLLVAAAFAGFLILNVRGHLFLGDVGSYLLGGAVSILVVAAVFDGVTPLAAVAPTLLYLTDTAVTLLKRVITGEKWFEAHRSHIYQRLTNFGLTHLQVAGIVCLSTAMCGAVGIIAMLASDGVWFGVSVLVLLCIVCGYASLPWLLARRVPKSISEGMN